MALTFETMSDEQKAIAMKFVLKMIETGEPVDYTAFPDVSQDVFEEVADAVMEQLFEAGIDGGKEWASVN